MKHTDGDMTVISRGLENVVVDTSSICHIDGIGGRLIYRGYDINELVNLSFEEIAFLLWNGELPTSEQLVTLQERFKKERMISQPMLESVSKLPPASNPLDILRTVISLMGAGLPLAKPSIDSAIAITAKIPTINAAFHRLRNNKEPIDPDPHYNHAANYLHMLTGEEPDPKKTEALDKYLILLAEHGMNASTFTARVVASTLSDMYSSITAAVCALKGPLHGGAPAPVLRMLHEIENPDRAEGWVKRELDADRRLMGFGHRVYRTTDPRAEILRSVAKVSADRDFLNLAVQVEATTLRMLHELRPRRKLYTNVEYYSAIVMDSVGLPADMFTATFAASRTAGWSAHVLEQVANNRLIRPEIEYTGPSNKTVKQLAQR
jgi:citrate synthase